jgi:hypothetical protein
MAVTRKQARAVLALVEERYASLIDMWAEEYGPRHSCRPRLIENWETPGGSTVRWTVAWESGSPDDEWAHRAVMGGVDQEVLLLAADVVGMAAAKEAIKPEEPIAFPAGVDVQPINGWALGIYEG